MYARLRSSLFASAMNRRFDVAGFTLIELLIVIVVLGILAAVVVFSLGGITASAAVSACEADAKTTALAVQAYEAQSNGTPPASLVALTQGPDPYLQEVPSSTYYAITLVNGSVMVAAPPSATAVSAANAGACSGADSSASVSPTSTTSTTTPTPTTTTTTSPTPTTTTTTTTTTTIPSNGVTVTASDPDSSDYFGQDLLTFTNTLPITRLSVTVTVSATPGVTLNGQTTSFPGGYITETNSTSLNGVITYTFTLNNSSGNDPIWASYPDGILYAQFNGSGNLHEFQDDTWSVTSTSGGITSMQSGTFPAVPGS